MVEDARQAVQLGLLFHLGMMEGVIQRERGMLGHVVHQFHVAAVEGIGLVGGEGDHALDVDAVDRDAHPREAGFFLADDDLVHAAQVQGLAQVGQEQFLLVAHHPARKGALHLDLHIPEIFPVIVQQTQADLVPFRQAEEIAVGGQGIGNGFIQQVEHLFHFEGGGDLAAELVDDLQPVDVAGGELLELMDSLVGHRGYQCGAQQSRPVCGVANVRQVEKHQGQGDANQDEIGRFALGDDRGGQAQQHHQPAEIRVDGLG